MMFKNIQNKNISIFIVVFIMMSIFGSGILQAKASGNDNAGTEVIYLPLVSKPKDPEIMLGIYAQGWTGQQTVFDSTYTPINNWSGKRISLAGTFVGIDVAVPEINIGEHFTLIWDNGYTPFVNIGISDSAYSVASGRYDAALIAWAEAYKTFATGGRFAYILPFPEMNGDWVSYYDDGNENNFKAAYWHIQQVFSDVGVPRDSVGWVFGPNGFSNPGDEFEKYYPGDDSVDVVAFSSYNFGKPSNLCPNALWQWPGEVFNNPNLNAPWVGYYLDRMRLLAPSKPIFVAQTGSTSYPLCYGGSDPTAKNAWLRDTYDYLARYPGVKAVIYFNMQDNSYYDWPFYVADNPARQYTGYKEGVSNPAYIYVDPPTLIGIDLSP